MPYNDTLKPIHRQFAHLDAIWSSFTNDESAKLLRWSVDDDEADLVSLFYDVQNERSGESSELFIHFNDAFESLDDYAYVLRSHLIHEYIHSASAYVKNELVQAWDYPTISEAQTAIDALIDACISFKALNGDRFKYMVLVITPSKIYDVKQWQMWIANILSRKLPSYIKLALIENKATPHTEKLVPHFRETIHSVTPNLDVRGALRDMADDEGCRQPEKEFKQLINALCHASTKSDLRKVNQLTTGLLRVAQKHQWLEMEVDVFLNVGAGFFASNNTKMAIHNYKKAQRAASHALAAGHPSGRKLFVQTRVAIAEVLRKLGSFDKAAKIYRSTASLCGSINDHTKAIECWWNVARCHEKTGQFEAAWDFYRLALRHGELSQSGVERNKVLAIVGLTMVQLARTQLCGKQSVEKVERRMILLLGQNWRQFSRVSKSNIPHIIGDINVRANTRRLRTDP